MSFQTSKNPTSVKIISLGCAKNEVDSEVIAGLAQKNGFQIVPSDAEAKIAVVNTCGFIESAKQESIDTILELAELKKQGQIEKIVVSGCLSQRYQKELPELLPEVDHFFGTNDFSNLAQSLLLNSSIPTKAKPTPSAELVHWDTPRIKANHSKSRYVKVSEGCSHSCSFCTIPLMRGGLKSRALDDVVEEIRLSHANGCNEFNLIAQDLNEYGRDLKPNQSLHALFEKLNELEGNFWLRPLYMYPLWFPLKLVRLMADHKHLVPYVDIPLQHISDPLLKSMRRGSNASYIYRLLENLKKHVPGIVLRTTFIVGYPGESDADFEKLVSFIQEVKFDRIGVFTYSDEESTTAFEIKNKVPAKVAKARRDKLMQVQREISFQKNQAYVGKELKVFFDGSLDLSDLEQIELSENSNNEIKSYLPFVGKGRFYGQAPEIDGQIYIQAKPEQSEPIPGEFIQVKINQAQIYDLWGELVE